MIDSMYRIQFIRDMKSEIQTNAVLELFNWLESTIGETRRYFPNHDWESTVRVINYDHIDGIKTMRYTIVFRKSEDRFNCILTCSDLLDKFDAK